MVYGVNTQKIVAIQRERIIKDLLPDICRIYPFSGSGVTISGSGIRTTEAPVARTWRGKTDIPCRSDLSRAFRPDKFKAQATEIDEFNLELPFDVIAEPSDLVHITNPNTGVEEIFEIRKRKNLSAFDGTIECIIATPGVELDGYS